MNSTIEKTAETATATATATTATAKTPIPINTILMHQQPHLDEVVAVTILRLYGEALFPGIGKAQIRFIEADILGTESEWDSQAILPVGICKGRFNEHRNGTPTGRLEGECAATLVMKYLGVYDNPELQKLRDETLEGDENPTNTPTQLAELMKVGYRNLKKDSSVVFGLVSTVVKAIISCERFRYSALSSEKTISEMWAKASEDDEELKGMPRVGRRLGNLIVESEKNHGNLVTELSSVIRALFRVPYDYDTVISPQFEFYMACLKSDIIEFQAVTEELKKVEPIWVRVLLHNRQQTIKMLVCKTDASQAAKAARVLGNHIVLLRNSSGNFQLFTSNKVFNAQGLSLTNVVRMIRWLSLPADKKAEADWGKLGQAGDHPDVPGIHYHKVAEAVYNGSLTHPAQASPISTQALIEAIKYGFDPHYVKMWCNDRKITMNREVVARIQAKRKEQDQTVSAS